MLTCAIDGGSGARVLNVRFWLKADIPGHKLLCPLYPRKRTFGGLPDATDGAEYRAIAVTHSTGTTAPKG